MTPRRIRAKAPPKREGKTVPSPEPELATATATAQAVTDDPDSLFADGKLKIMKRLVASLGGFALALASSRACAADSAAVDHRMYPVSVPELETNGASPRLATALTAESAPASRPRPLRGRSHRREGPG